MSFSALSSIVWARKLSFTAVFLLVMVSAAAFCLVVTPIYQSRALLMIAPNRSLGQQQHEQAPYPDTIRYQVNSQIYIIESEDVLREAINQIGPRTILHEQNHFLRLPNFYFLDLQPMFSSFAHFIRPREIDSEQDRALLKAKKRLSAIAEKDSQVLSLTFQHEDPNVAEQFLQLVLNGFIKRQADLSGNAEAPLFFQQQAERYRDDYRRASSDLNEFAKKHSTYSIGQEVNLALGRRDEILAALAKTRGSIAEKEAQGATLQNTLTQLRRRISLPAEVTGPKYKPQPSGADGLTDANKIPANESPLLLVRVFQETAQQLVNLNSSIGGLRALETAQSQSLSDVEKRLGDLSSVEAHFGRLKSDVDQAQKILEAHVGRAAEAQMNADWDASEKLSSVKVVQAATKPVKPVFPPKPLVMTLGAAIGLIGGAAASVLLDTMSSRRRRSAAWSSNQYEGVGARNVRLPEPMVPAQERAEYRVRERRAVLPS
jgi:polysaccharide biosynthesis transport protein